MSASFSTGLIGGNFVIGDNRIISISPSSGNNTAGQNLTLQAGQGTGTGTGGNIIFQTAPGGSSGSSANDLATKLTVTPEGIQVAGTGSMSDTLSLTKSSGTGLSVTKDATIGGNLTVTGNLTVSGTSTTITSSTLEVNDKNIVIGNVSGPTNTTADGGGITLKANGDKTIIYTNSGDRWTSNIHWNIASGKAYQINGTAILTSTALGSTVVASSLTSVGTLSSLTVSGDATFDTSTLFVDSSANNVGIGTTTPDKYFYNASATGGSFTSTDRILAIHGGTSGQNNGVARLVLACDSNHTASIFAKHTGSGNTHMGFLTTDGTAAPVERMRIDEEGNVGIGTTSPTEKLEIGENSETHDSTDKIMCVSQQKTYKYNFGITKWNKYSSGSGKYDLEIGWKDTGNTTNNNNYGHIILTPKLNVGIGTTTPSHKLDVSGTGRFTGALTANVTGNLTGSVLTASQTDITSVGTLSSLNVSGDVGIGTTSPNAPLEIHGGAGSGDEVLILSNSKDSSTTGLHAIFLDGGHHYDVYNSSTIQTGKSTSNGSNYHMNRYSAGDVTMVAGGGKVGIGDTTPSYKLDVAGDINFTGTLRKNGTEYGAGSSVWTTSGSNINYTAGKVGIGTTSPDSTARLTISPSGSDIGIIIKSSANSVTGVNNTLDWKNNGGTTVARMGPESSSHGRFIFKNVWDHNTGSADNGGFRFQVNDSPVIEALQINSNGKVGIGTTSPLGTLHIQVPEQYENGLFISSSHGTYGSDSDGGVYHFNHYNHATSTRRGLLMQERNTTGVFKRNIMIFQRGTGNVGIGSGGNGFIEPSYKLDVSGTGRFTDTLSLTKSSGTGLSVTKDATIGGNLTVTGNLIINGTTTTVNSTTVTVDDPIITLGGDTAPGSDDNKDRGVEFRYYDGSAKVGFMGWDNDASNRCFVLLKDATNSSEVFSGTAAELKVGSLTIGSDTVSNLSSLLTTSSALSSLSNVHTATPSDNQVLTWDGTNNRWEPANASGGGASALNGLSDVSTSGAQSNYALVYNGSSWAPAAQSGSGGGSAVFSGTVSANVVHQRMTDITTISITANGGKTEIEGLRLTITPQSSSSKVELNYNIFHEANNWNYGFLVSRTVGGTETFFRIADATNDLTFSASYHNEYTSLPQTTSYSMIDEPNTTGVVVYKVYGAATFITTAITLYINRTKNDTTSTGQEHGISTSSVKEFSNFTHNIAEQKVQGRVLEVLTGVCDGRSISVSSGTYTIEEVTGVQNIGTTYVDAKGSVINYKPPSGARQVIYKFTCTIGGDYSGTHPICHTKLLVDGTEVTNFRTTQNGNHSMGTTTFVYIFEIGKTDSASSGKFSSWNTNKTIKIQVREYNNTGNSSKLHETKYWDAATSSQFSIPKLEIQAIGEENLVYNLTNQYSITEGQVLETIAGVCDGRSVSGSSGTYTIPSVTASMQLTSSYQDIPGSKISYKPPVGTTTIIFNFNALMGYVGAADIVPISHWKLYVDNVEITSFRRSISSEHMEIPTDIKYIFTVGGVNDVANGKFSTWNTQKEIKLMAREFGNQWEVKLFETFHWDGSEGNNFATPFLEIQAIGKGIIEGTIGNLYSSKVNMNFITDDTLQNFTVPDTKPGVVITPLTISITPQFVDSVIEIKFVIGGELKQDGTVFNISRTVNGVETELNSSTDIFSGMSVVPYDGNNYAGTPISLPIHWYDEPNTTSIVTYKLKLNGTWSGSGHTFYYNGSKNTPAANGNEKTFSSACLIELPQQTVMHNPRYNSVIEQEGQVLETLAGVCDGRSVTVSSGTYTLDNVDDTTRLSSISTWVDIPGSTLNYKPPPGTKQVLYNFNFQYGAYDSAGALFTMKIEIDGVEIPKSYMQIEDSRGGTADFQYVIDIGNVSSDDMSIGKLASWDSYRTLNVSMCLYHTSYDTDIHGIRYGNVSSSGQGSSGTDMRFHGPPRLEVKAIGRKSDTTFLNSFFNERKGQVLETLTGVCDGRTVEVDSGTYTFEEVTAAQTMTAAWVKATGSEISYKPPPGTTVIKFTFRYAMRYWSNSIDVWHQVLYLDGTQVSSTEETVRPGSQGNFETMNQFVCILSIGGTNDVANGKLASWDTLKKLEIRMGSYESSRLSKLHASNLQAFSSGTDLLIPPQITIQAIGDAAIQNATVVAGNSMVHFQGYSTTYTLTSGTKYVTNYGNAPSSGISSGIPQLKNFGNAMNTSTGIFTTPHTGLYNINAINHHQGKGTNACWVELVIDNKYIQFGDHDVSYGDLGASSVYHIDSGKEVYLRIGSTSDSNYEPTAVSLTVTALQDQVPQAISARPGMTLETIAGVCDGSSVTVSSGTYTLPNVTNDFGVMTNGTTYVELPGSFSYKPPTGTNKVIYRFKINIAGYDTHGIANFKLYVDDTEVTKFIRSWTGHGPDEGPIVLDYTFEIGKTNDITSGKFLTWDTLKTIKIKVRSHTASSHRVQIFSRGYWEGSYMYNEHTNSGGDGFVQPSLEIVAIGDGPGIVPSTGMNMVHASDTVYKNPTISSFSKLDYEFSEMKLVIKPTATDSVIELKYNIFGDIGENICFRVTRNISGTDVLVVPASNHYEGALAVPSGRLETASTPEVINFNWYDEPNTTSTVTYKLWIGASHNSTIDCHLNRSGNTPGNYIEAGVSTAAAIEYPKTARPLDTENALTIPPFVGATNKEKLYNQSGDLYFNGKQLSNEWYKNGSDMYRLGANVGIGKSSPAYKLDVLGDINFTGTLRQNGTVYGGGGGSSVWTTSGSNINYTAGKVGIGTTSPQTILDLKGSSTTYPLQLRGGATGGVQSVFSWAGNPWNSTGYAHYIKTRHNGSADAGNAFDFYVWQTSDSSSALGTKHVLTIDGPGVGIGTTSPDTKLHVNGGKLLVTNTNGSTAFGRILGGHSDNAHAIHFRVGEDGATDVLDFHEYGKIRFYTNGLLAAQTEKMCILSNGNVGIGTTSPGSPLEVVKKGSAGTIAYFHSDTAGNSGINVSPKVGSDGDGYIELGGGNSSTTHGKHAFIGCTRNGSDTYNSNIVFKTRSDANSLGYQYHAATEHMRIQYDGKVGIGTTSPQTTLDIQGDGTNCLTLRNGNSNTGYTKSQILLSYAGNPYNSSGYCHKIQSRHNSSTAHNDNAIDFYLWKNGQGAGDIGNTHGMSITAAGVGIGTTSPDSTLHVNGNASTTVSFTRYYQLNVNSTSVSTYSSGLTQSFGLALHVDGRSLFSGTTFMESDSRIKENIEDVPDNQALEMIRNIPCRYYEYKDKLGRGSDKTIGFIAQEVKSILPMAVSIETSIIPSVYKVIQCEWTGSVMYSQELGTVSGVKYKFYVSNTNNDEVEKIVTGSSDNTFTFEQQWNNVFCYGREVDDLHTLDKNKLFALNFSATQELDRQQQADKAKIASLETKVASLESELAAIKAHLGL